MDKVFNKLVRDRIPEIIESKGEIPHTRILNDDEYRRELYRKLEEECGEVVSASNKEDRCEELADVLEVLEAICFLDDTTMDEVNRVKEEKKNKRGGFEGKIYLIGSSSK